MKINITKLKFNIFNDEDMDVIKRSFKKMKGDKLNKAKTILEENGIESIADRFIEGNVISELDLDLIEKLIIICKNLYANDKTLLSDSIYDPMVNKFKEYRAEPIVDVIVSKRVVDVDHQYPELKGTLDKANVVYEKDKYKKLDRSVEKFIKNIFEVSKNNEIKFRLSKKYDGVSGIGSIEDDTVKLLLTRGEDGKGADLTHLIKDISFNNKGNAGVKFEIVISKDNFDKYNKIREKLNKKPVINQRAAVVSIITSNEASKYSNLLTFMPLYATNVDNDACLLNDKYAIDDYFSYEDITTSSCEDALSKIDKYISETAMLRDEFEFAIDGIVIDCLNKKVIKTLGRTNDINNYQVAYKFPSEGKATHVVGTSITVGRTGLITPMVEYLAIHFNGTKHNSSSLSSYDRFKKMGLVEGEQVYVTYNNDVMPYVNIVNSVENEKLRKKNKPLEFPTHCTCGNKLKLIGANYYCDSIKCGAKKVAQFTWFLKTFGVRDIAENRVQDLIDEGIFNEYEDLLNPDYNSMINIEGFAEKSINALKKQIENINNSIHSEAQLANALGVAGEKTCKEILTAITLQDILEDPSKLYTIKIRGVEQAKKESFITNILIMIKELKYYMEKLTIYSLEQTDDKVKVCFTGFRDKNIETILEALGMEVTKNLTKDTKYLVVKNEDAKSLDSPKLDKAEKYAKHGVQIITLAELNDIMKEIE